MRDTNDSDLTGESLKSRLRDLHKPGTGQGCLLRAALREIERLDGTERKNALAAQEERRPKVLREIEEGRLSILIPGKYLPPDATDQEINQEMDESYGLEFTREETRVIIWVEM